MSKKSATPEQVTMTQELDKRGYLVKCSKCSYRWEPRVLEPKSCPRCKARFDTPFKPQERVA